jgi:hypothetical protein
MTYLHDRFPVESLIRAAGGRDEDMHKLAAEFGVEEYVTALVNELVSRCEPPVLDRTVLVHLALGYESQRHDRVLEVSGAGVRHSTGAPDGAQVQISTDLLSLTRSLFGPASFDGYGLRRVEVRLDASASETPPPGRQLEVGPGELRRLDRPDPLVQAAQSVVAACASRPTDLGDLAIRFGSDKWGVWHWYTRHYDKHFSPLRYEPIRLLEIGIGGYADPNAGGGSLRMWKNYFPRAIVYGMDIYDKTGVEESRIHTVNGSQADPEFLTAFAEQNGPFDIIIDDGSHLNEHVLISFQTLFPYVRPGGWYVIEDMQTSYWPQYGGASGDVAGEGTSVGLLKKLLDGLAYQESTHPRGFTPSYADQHVVGVHAYHNMAFIEKGLNAEATIPSWVKRAPVSFFYRDGAEAGPR